MVAQNESKTQAAEWEHVGNGIEVHDETATVRVLSDVVCPAKRDYLESLMPVVGLDRPAGDVRADVLVYIRLAEEDRYVYVDTVDVRRMKGECIRKPMGYGLADEVAAEVSAARELVDQVYLRRVVL